MAGRLAVSVIGTPCSMLCVHRNSVNMPQPVNRTLQRPEMWMATLLQASSCTMFACAWTLTW
jgi:hypothetical protein